VEKPVATEVPAEIEAKLLVRSEADLRAIGQLTEIGPYRLRPLRTQRLHSLYLDTDDLALARHGIALRVRRCGRHWELTAKWEGRVDGDIHSRPERTVALDAAPTSPFRLRDPTLRRSLVAVIAGRPLRVVLVTDIQRRRLELLALDNPDGDEPARLLAEIALDAVRLHGEEDGGPQQRFREVEIEQRDGKVDDLRAVVDLLRERFVLEASTETKFSRGLALLHDFRRNAQDDLLSLSANDNVVAAARKLTARQLAQIRRHDPGTRAGENPEHLHDMRVAVRRLRAVLKTLKGGFAVPLQVFLRDELRWLGAALGEVRDLDVQIGRLTALVAVMPPALRDGFKSFLAHLERERAQRRDKLLGVLDSARYMRLLRRLERFATGHSRVRSTSSAAAPVGPFAAASVARTHRKLLAQGKKVHREPLPEELHALRIRAKRLRYVLEYFADLGGKPARKAARKLAKLQDLLGEYNDAVVTASFVQQYVAAPPVPMAAPELLTLGAIIGNEIARGERLRGRFRRRWKRFANKRTDADVQAVVEVLAARADGTNAGWAV